MTTLCRRHSPLSRFTVAIALTVALDAASIRAEQSGTAPAAPSGNQPVAGWNNGVFIQSPDGQNRLQIGVMLHADARFAPGEDGLVDTFAIRRGRASFRGRIADRFEFYLNPDFAGGTLVVQDAYIETRFSTAVRVRFGKQKTPFGNERAHAIGNLLFLERALPTALSPNRDVGIQILGDLRGGLLTYGVELANGVRDGASSDADTDNNKELAARVVVRPFVRTPADPLAGLSIALSGTTSSQTTPAGLPLYRTTVFQQAFFTYSGATADGQLNRVSPYISFYRKAFGGFVEIAKSSLPVAKGGVSERIAHHAWQAAASWVLTGEAATEAGVQADNAFNFGNGGWGAVQIALRYHALSIDQKAFDLGLAALDSSRKARAWSLGANWYLNRHLKYVFLFERTTFAGGALATRTPENVVAFRTQLAF